MVSHRGRGRQLVRRVTGQEVDPLAPNRLPEGEVLRVLLGEQLLEGAWIHDRAREAVFPQCAGLFQHADVQVGHASTRVLVLLDQAGKFDGTG